MFFHEGASGGIVVAVKPLRDTLRRNLSAFERLVPTEAPLKAAAVAIVVVYDPVQAADCFLLTRRSSRLRGHSAQYALPGGRLEQ